MRVAGAGKKARAGGDGLGGALREARSHTRTESFVKIVHRYAATLPCSPRVDEERERLQGSALCRCCNSLDERERRLREVVWARGLRACDTEIRRISRIPLRHRTRSAAPRKAPPKRPVPVPQRSKRDRVRFSNNGSVPNSFPKCLACKWPSPKWFHVP